MTDKGKEEEAPEPEKEHRDHKGRKSRKHAAQADGSEKSAELQGEIDASNDRLLRLQADFENFRKRTLREKGEIYERASEELMLELLPVLDHLDLALSHAESNGGDRAFVDGVKLVADQLLTVLGRFNLSAVDANDSEFDPHIHEAVSHLPSDTVAENHVIAQTRKGYLLGGKLLRPAQVVVSSGPVDNPAETAESETGEAGA